MLERYTRTPLGSLWSREQQYQIWRSVEVQAAKVKGAPDAVVNAINETPVPSLSEIDEEEARCRHDVLAFLNTWRASMPADVAGWVHRGMTSSDLVDTANAFRLSLIHDELSARINELEATLANHAIDHWRTPRVARTHGQNAQGSTWGYRVADLTMALGRASGLLRYARDQVCVAKLSGPVGDYRSFSLNDEIRLGETFSLEASFSATQVVSRDRLASYMFALSQVASVIEAIALEIRLGSHSQVGELAEGFADGQQGSSAMPHKQNPITSEQLCGLAKIVRAQVVPIQEGVALWHERDISHSSVERIAVQTATTLVHYMLVKANYLVRDLRVFDAVMLANLDSARDATSSARIKDLLIEGGVHPTKAWNLVRDANLYRQYEPLVDQVNALLEAAGETYRLPTLQEEEHPDTAHVLDRMHAIIRRHRGVTVWFYPNGEFGNGDARTMTRWFRTGDVF